MRRKEVICIVLPFLILAGCSNQASGQPESVDLTPAMDASGAATAVVPTPIPTDTPEPTPTTSYPPPPVLSYLPSLYEDEEGRFIFYYPVEWNEGYGERQSRGYFRQLLSWDTTGSASIENRPEGGTYMQVTVYAWDPVNDLDAYVQQRKSAWENSGISILSEQEMMVNGMRALTFFTQGLDGGEPSFVFWMALGDRYLEISGMGDYQLLAEIASTVRVID